MNLGAQRRPASIAGAGCCLAALLLGLGCAAPHAELGPTLARLARQGEGKLVAIAYRDAGTGDTASVHGSEVVHAASTMKLPVMLELFARADRGQLDLDAPIPLRNEFHSIVDGSPYALNPADDSDPELYERVGREVTIRELITAMIARSSNLATNALIALAEPARVEARCRDLGAHATHVLRGVEDGKAFARGLNNVTTADDLATLLMALARGQAASPAACAAMRAILLAQEDNDLIPAGLPPGTRVEHKTGQITNHRHDAAIVTDMAGDTYVLVVLTRGFANPGDAARVIAEVARTVHERRRLRPWSSGR